VDSAAHNRRKTHASSAFADFWQDARHSLGSMVQAGVQRSDNGFM